VKSLVGNGGSSGAGDSDGQPGFIDAL